MVEPCERESVSTSVAWWTPLGTVGALVSGSELTGWSSGAAPAGAAEERPAPVSTKTDATPTAHLVATRLPLTVRLSMPALVLQVTCPSAPSSTVDLARARRHLASSLPTVVCFFPPRRCPCPRPPPSPTLCGSFATESDRDASDGPVPTSASTGQVCSGQDNFGRHPYP